jgi:hypothetical protein
MPNEIQEYPPRGPPGPAAAGLARPRADPDREAIFGLEDGLWGEGLDPGLINSIMSLTMAALTSHTQHLSIQR